VEDGQEQPTDDAQAAAPTETPPEDGKQEHPEDGEQ